MERGGREGSHIGGLQVVFEALKHLPSRREDWQNGGCHPTLQRECWAQETMSQRCFQTLTGKPSVHATAPP